MTEIQKDIIPNFQYCFIKKKSLPTCNIHDFLKNNIEDAILLSF